MFCTTAVSTSTPNPANDDGSAAESKIKKNIKIEQCCSRAVAVKHYGESTHKEVSKMLSSSICSRERLRLSCSACLILSFTIVTLVPYHTTEMAYGIAMYLCEMMSLRVDVFSRPVQDVKYCHLALFDQLQIMSWR